MTNKHKRWSALFLIKEKQIDTRGYFSSTKNPGNDSKRLIIPWTVRNVGKRNSYAVQVVIEISVNILESRLAVSIKTQTNHTL